MTATDNNRACLDKIDKKRYNNPTNKERGNAMENADKVGPIQRYYYEDMMCRRDKEVEKWHKAWKTTFIALIVAVCIIIGGIIGFIYYEAQFEDVVYTVESETDGGGTAIANATGEVVFNGESKSDYQTPDSQDWR